MEKYVIRPKFEIVLTDGDIDDIMATALDSGISYWCYKAEVVGGVYHGEWASDEISRGGRLRLYDNESDDKWILTKMKFVRGFTRWIECGWGRDAICDGQVDCGMIDAIAADQIVQFALFNDIVFG